MSNVFVVTDDTTLGVLVTGPAPQRTLPTDYSIPLSSLRVADTQGIGFCADSFVSCTYIYNSAVCYVIMAAGILVQFMCSI